MAHGIPQTIPYIHHLHTYVNVLEVSGKKMARLKFLKSAWEKLRTRTMRHAAKIIAVNQDVVAMGERIVGADRVIAFPNYVDMRVFAHQDAAQLRENLGLQQKRVALFIGRISFVKGLELFADAVRALNRRHDTPWVGVIVGNGDYQPTLEAYLDKVGIRQQFIFTGPVNEQKALREYYSLADVFLVTSLSESVPLTLLESLACGTPVVSTDVGIAAGVLGTNNGFVVATRDANEFSEKVLASVPFKTTANLIPTPYDYSVERASALLNREFEIYSNIQKSYPT
jgi:glycosyltransferase involved in cell wall biosynthesis